jgi:alpha-amylase
LGKFRAAHPAVGAGVHQKIASSGQYWFVRSYKEGSAEDKVVVGLDLPKGEKNVNVEGIFPAGTKLRDAYSGKTAQVSDRNHVSVNSEFTIVLLEKE